MTPFEFKRSGSTPLSVDISINAQGWTNDKLIISRHSELPHLGLASDIE